MRAKTFLIFLAPLVVTTACIRSHRAPTVVYYTPHVPPVVATSDRPVTRVYTEPAPTAVPAPPPGAPAVSGDVAIGSSISQLLKGDPELASLTTSVESTGDRGVVTLRGTVPTEHDRDEIATRVARLPGVDRVNNQLAVERR